MAAQKHLDTHHKALSINLDPKIFGSFAEIGAGQEVARWFLRVGAASGTVAKTISAYDKKVSDDLYGGATRYVSRQRLEAMLDHEWNLLARQLGAARGSDTRFFVFADTLSARNFAGTNECHGWMGLRFQTRPDAALHDVILHVNMMDGANLLQQQALGILGVNLIHAAFFRGETTEGFLAALFDDLAHGRVEIDLAAFLGPEFDTLDPGSHSWSSRARATPRPLLSRPMGSSFPLLSCCTNGPSFSSPGCSSSRSPSSRRCSLPRSCSSGLRLTPARGSPCPCTLWPSLHQPRKARRWHPATCYAAWKACARRGTASSSHGAASCITRRRSSTASPERRSAS